MADNKKMETMLAAECQPEAEEVLQFMAGLNEDGKKGFLMFIRGAKYMQNLFSGQAETVGQH